MRSTEKLSQDFEQIVSAPTVSRSKLLLEICGPDLRLKSAYETLVTQIKNNEHRRERIGTMLGPYRIQSILGVGGAGTVYRAERADRQYRAAVAIKIMELFGGEKWRYLAIRAERQILASMNHPWIARLLDAGETPDSTPYFVMELVDGVPLDVFCDGHQLTINERLELLEKVCDAVGYAHNNLIVHRDLKPSNVLVTADSQPKLLDFGIAKLVDSIPDPASFGLTRENDRLLTPEFASPEQILGRPVTTASDIYSLGVLLYLVLTGRSPHQISGVTQLELERSVCITNPQWPSSTFDTDDSGPQAMKRIAEIAGRRRSTPKQLKRLLRGDLDAIVMKALRKEPAHRYANVMQLADDLRRFRRGEKVSVSRDGVTRRAVRLLRSAFVATSRTSSEWVESRRVWSPESMKRVTELSEKTGLSAREIVRRALTVFDPGNAEAEEHEAWSALESAHERLRACLLSVDNELNRNAVQARAYEDGSLAAHVRSQVKAWVSDNPDALRALSAVVHRPGGQL